MEEPEILLRKQYCGVDAKNQMENIKSIVNIVRPINLFITLTTVIVAGLFCMDQISYSNTLFLGAVASAFVAAAGNIINDVFDVEIDKINRPERVLPSNLLSKRYAQVLYISFVVFSIIGGALIDITSLIIISGTNILLFFYSYRLKSIPLVGNIAISSMTGLAFLYGGILVNNITDAIIPSVFAFMVTFIREILKDIEDMEGDGKIGCVTFPIIAGVAKAKQLLVMLTLLLLGMTFYPFLTELYKIEYFIFMMLFVNTIFFYFIKSLNNSSFPQNIRKLSNLLKLSMLLGLIAVYLGK